MTTVLLVEDNEMNRDALSRILQRRGYELSIAVDGGEGLRLARESRPDLILLDLSLPVIDGWEVTRRLRADAATRELAIIALSAHASRGDRESALAAGADDFESKPVDTAQLTAKMEALLVKRRGGAALNPSLTRPARREHLDELVQFAVDQARAAGADDDAQHAIRLAIEEVCLNVMLHGYAAGALGPVSVEVERGADRVVVRVRDEARRFDPTTLPSPPLDADLNERAPGGLGWHLVYAMMDEVRHAPGQPTGNIVTLVKLLNR